MQAKRKKYASIWEKQCVACGCCVKVCPREAIQVWKGNYATVDQERCVGCGICVRTCPASVIELVETEQEKGGIS